MSYNKTGLNYYNTDTDRYQDIRIKRLKRAFGCNGIAVYDYILCEVYRDKGCYLTWEENIAFDVADYFGLDESQVHDIVRYCAEVGLFDPSLLSRGIITSASIQRRYLDMSARAKRKCVNIPEEYRIIPEESPKIPEECEKTPEDCDKVKYSKVKYSNNYSNPDGLEIIPPLLFPPIDTGGNDTEQISIPDQFVSLWDSFGGKRKALVDDYKDFCKKTKGLIVDYETLRFHARLEKKRYFQSWLIQFLTNSTQRDIDQPTHPVNNHPTHDAHEVAGSAAAKEAKAPDPDFEAFWEAYGKKRGRRDVEAYWARLPARDKAAALSGVPGYVAANPDPAYRKDPIRYLRHRCWEDENYSTTDKKTNEPHDTERPTAYMARYF